MQSAHHPARLLPRLTAYLLDAVWSFGVLMAVQFAVNAWIIGDLAPWRASGWLLEIWTAGTISAPAWFLLAAFDASRSGATPGERVVGIRVTAADGGRLPFAHAVEVDDLSRPMAPA